MPGDDHIGKVFPLLCLLLQTNWKRTAWTNVHINGYLFHLVFRFFYFGEIRKNDSKLDAIFLWHEQSMGDSWTFPLWILLTKTFIITWIGSCSIVDRQFVIFINLYFFYSIFWTNIYWMPPVVKHSPNHQRDLLLW